MPTVRTIKLNTGTPSSPSWTELTLGGGGGGKPMSVSIGWVASDGVDIVVDSSMDLGAVINAQISNLFMGGSIIIREGSYNLKTSIDMREGVDVLGCGSKTAISLASPGSKYVSFGPNCNRAKFGNVKLGSYSSNAGGTNGALIDVAGSGNSVCNLYFHENQLSSADLISVTGNQNQIINLPNINGAGRILISGSENLVHGVSYRTHTNYTFNMVVSGNSNIVSENVLSGISITGTATKIPSQKM